MYKNYFSPTNKNTKVHHSTIIHRSPYWPSYIGNIVIYLKFQYHWIFPTNLTQIKLKWKVIINNANNFCVTHSQNRNKPRIWLQCTTFWVTQPKVCLTYAKNMIDTPKRMSNSRFKQILLVSPKNLCAAHHVLGLYPFWLGHTKKIRDWINKN